MSSNRNDNLPRFRGVKYQPLTSSLGEAAHYASNGVSRIRQRLPAWLIIGVCCILGITITLPFLSSQYSTATATGAATQADQVAIRLHPEDHIARRAKTLTFDWRVTQGMRAIDGVEKQVYLVNDQFPGPTIEARSGDRIIVNVDNALDDQGLSLHWHGLRMKNYNHMDGAVGITQCPIPSNRKHVYDFTIGNDEAGTFWWHSHNQVQRGDGLYGGLVIHQPNTRRTIANPEYLLLVGDWFHRQQQEVLAWFSNSASLGNEPTPDSMVINGQGRYNCSMAVVARPIVCRDTPLRESLPIFKEKTNAKLRVVNVGTIAGVSLAVSGATLQPTHVDSGWPVKAVPGDVLGVLYPGERADAIMKWTQKDDQPSWLSMYLDDENFKSSNEALNPEQSFLMLPPKSDVEIAPKPKPLSSYKHYSELTTVQSAQPPTEVLSKEADMTLIYYFKTKILAHLGNSPMGSMNGTAWQPQSPPLLASGRSTWDDNQLVSFIPSLSTPKQVDIILNNRDDGGHPVHFHGNPFYVLASGDNGGDPGWASYNPFDPEDEPGSPINLVNPVRRDTVLVPKRGHVVLRLIADNLGFWLMHCHMLVHMGTGMAATLHIGDASDEAHARVNTQAAELCSK